MPDPTTRLNAALDGRHRIEATASLTETGMTLNTANDMSPEAATVAPTTDTAGGEVRVRVALNCFEELLQRVGQE